jgi:hypothetical protein
MIMPKFRQFWKTTQIIAAAPGWRALYFDAEGVRPFSCDLVGWAWQVNQEDPEEERVVGMVVEDGEWLQIDSENFWKILCPSAPRPTTEDYKKAVQRRQEILQR